MYYIYILYAIHIYIHIYIIYIYIHTYIYIIYICHMIDVSFYKNVLSTFSNLSKTVFLNIFIVFNGWFVRYLVQKSRQIK